MSDHYADGSCRVTVTFTGKNGLWQQWTVWANPDLLEDIMEHANPRRKNGRVKAVTVTVEFFYNGRNSYGNTWGPRLEQAMWYMWFRPAA